MRKITSIVILSLVIAMVTAISGCVCCNYNFGLNTGTDNQGKDIGTYVDGKTFVDVDRINWFAYKITTTGGTTSPYTTNVRIEYKKDTYEGVPARHVVADIDSPELKGTFEYYFNEATREVLKSHMSMNASGIKIEMDVPVDQMGDKFGDLKIEDPLISTGESRYALMGTETVTVPAGTYQNAKKYVKEDADTTVWVSDKAPVPVKIVSNDDRHSTTVELTGWG
jgi:hypothetical protein